MAGIGAGLGVNAGVEAGLQAGVGVGYGAGYGGFTTTGVILVLFILLVIISRVAWA